VNVRLDPAATRDLDEYLDPIEDDNPVAAQRQEKRIRDTLARLAAYPRLGRRTRIVGGPPGVRGFTIAHTPLVAFYVAEPGGIRVLRLYHGARAPIER
jgi:plasmid stabilization system protein ParE